MKISPARDQGALADRLLTYGPEGQIAKPACPNRIDIMQQLLRMHTDVACGMTPADLLVESAYHLTRCLVMLRNQERRRLANPS